MLAVYTNTLDMTGAPSSLNPHTDVYVYVDIYVQSTEAGDTLHCTNALEKRVNVATL